VYLGCLLFILLGCLLLVVLALIAYYLRRLIAVVCVAWLHLSVVCRACCLLLSCSLLTIVQV
jgi:uncharacterized membrane protein YGL010W